MDKQVLTIATGKKVYVDMAVNLARSFRLWNSDSAIRFYLVTDQQQHLPNDVKTFVHIIPVKAGEFGVGFSPKLHLDKFAPPGQTLFIDSDCLIYGPIDHLFQKFKGRTVSVVGGYKANGEWFGDIAAICKKFKLQQLPKFNGGIYYLENGPQAQKVYEMGRQFEKEYDDIGFVRLRDHPNDEVIISLAMAINGQTPIPDDGSIMSDPLSCPGKFSTNILKGKTKLFNPPAPHPLHQQWYPLTRVHPVIVHYLGAFTHSYQYKMDAFRLRALQSGGSKGLAELNGLLKIEIPMRLKAGLKNVLRPAFKLLFGTRSVKPSERI